jgi:hypothetical protein
LAISGSLVGGFRFVEIPRAIPVLNAACSAATTSLAIGREIAAKAQARFAR